ncbi:hypothetical protein [Treponema pedis]|uniref:hypothetical protein n=1 Tax=Treponema pedis TaxID=409322 RepID=UPI0003F72053|nr:hypothetical protein [Treponema pedis]
MKKKIFLLGTIILIFTSCAAIEESTKNGFGKPRNIETPEYRDIQEYTSLGEDESFMRSINKAKIGAIRQGVIDIIGLYSEQANQERLKEILYNTENPNRYIVNADMKILQKSKNGNLYICKAVVPVKMREVASLLQSAGISEKSENLPAPKTIDDLAFGESAINDNENSAARNHKDADTVLAEAIASSQGKENIRFLNNYIENITYMVFNAENSSADRFLLKSGVETANGYLLKQGYRAVDAAEVEKLKKDNSLIYTESSSENLSVIQFIAQKLNADIYMELDAVTEGGYENGGYYGSAKITLKIFNPSTGELLGSVPYSSPKTFSKTSSYDAQSNAIQSTVYKALPLAIDQAKILLAKAYSGGIRYEITINDTPDSKSMARFRKELKNNVRDLKTLHQSAAQTKYAVFLFGTIDDLETIVYDTAEAVPGFEKMELVVLRGKTLTFKSGF